MQMAEAVPPHKERADVIVDILNVRLPFEDKRQAQIPWTVQCTSGKVTNITPFLQKENITSVVDSISEHIVINGNGDLLLPA